MPWLRKGHGYTSGMTNETPQTSDFQNIHPANVQAKDVVYSITPTEIWSDLLKSKFSVNPLVPMRFMDWQDGPEGKEYGFCKVQIDIVYKNLNRSETIMVVLESDHVFIKVPVGE